MEQFFLVLLTLACTAIVARFILKKYNPIFIFLAAGVIIIMIASILTNTSVLEKATTGNMFIDIFAFITKSFTTNTSGIGSIIMAVTGYAMYMSHIKASTKLAVLATKPLAKLQQPYLVLSGIFLIGMALKLVITSQAGLALLMVTTTFPILISLGVNKLTAASVLSLLCIDWGPNDGSTIFIAGVLKMPVVNLFLEFQLQVCLIIISVVAILIPFYYKYVDSKDTEKSENNKSTITKMEDPDCPTFYVLLPIIPLLIVLGFHFIPTIKMDIVTANFIGFAITFIIEFIRRKDRREIGNDMKVIVRAMGDIFCSVIAIIISASVFAKGIGMLGGIGIMADALSSLQGAGFITSALMTVITYCAGAIMGSGAAAIFAFGPLVPGLAANLGIPAISMIVPMELAASLGRSMSPVAGAIIAISGFAEVDTMKMIRRSAPLLIIALVVNIFASYLLGVFIK